MMTNKLNAEELQKKTASSHQANSLDATPPQTASFEEDKTEEAWLFPLTPQQMSRWQAFQKDPEDSVVNGAFRLGVEGEPIAVIFEAAFNELVQRHEILRARVIEIGGVPQMVIPQMKPINLDLIDLRSLSSKDAESEMDRLCIEIARRPFNLTQGPLLRVSLIRMTDTRAVLTLTVHSIICDLWSIGLLMNEYALIYKALARTEPIDLPELEIEFGDYSVWLQDRLKENEIKRQIVSWKRQLKGYRRLDVPGDLIEATTSNEIDSDIVTRMLPLELSKKLLKFSATQGGTMFITTLAACFALLSHETGLVDLSIGTPVATRNSPETERLVGLLLNDMILRVRLSGDPTLRGLEAMTRETVLDSYSLNEVPLEHIVQSIRADGGQFPDPALSVCFVCKSENSFNGTRPFTCDKTGIKVAPLPSKSQGALFDLFFFAIEREDGWRLSLDYRTTRYSKQKAEQLLEDFYRILQQIVTEPDECLSRLQLTGPGRKIEDTANPSTNDLTPESETKVASVISSSPELPGEAIEQNATNDDVIILPASFSQERFWLLTKAAPDNTAFNMPVFLKISGPLDIDRLKKSFQKLTARHEMIRTTFQQHDGQLSQLVLPEYLFNLERTDLIGQDEAAQEQKLNEEMKREATTPFDLASQPVWRARILKKSETEHILILVMHHIISDGQSFGNLQQELWKIYDGLSCASGSHDLPALDLQFGDFAEWQRNWVQTEDADTQLDYWKQLLSSPLPVLDFPLDRSPAHDQNPAGKAKSNELPATLVEKLKALALAENTTMFAVTSAVFSTLLARYSNSSDILFGCPVANRTVETEALIGPFSGPLAVRVTLDGNPDLHEVIKRSSDTIFDGLSNTEIPFERIMDEIDMRSIQGRNPLFQFYFLYQKAFVQDHNAHQLSISPLSSSTSLPTPYELQLSLIERPDNVSAQLTYNPAILDDCTVDRILSFYIDLLNAFVDDPEQQLSDLPKPEISPDSFRLTDTSSKDRVITTPRNSHEERLMKLWESVLRHKPISIHDDFFELGGQSILAARLIILVEQEFGLQLNISVLAQTRTIAKLGELLSAPDKIGSSHLVTLKTGGDKNPLFLIHCGGGHILRYNDFVSVMPDDQSIYGVCAPPINSADDATSVEQLASLYVRDLLDTQPKGPYKLGGYSFGGLIAYEMACQLHEQGEVVDMLAIFDTANPAFFRDLPFIQHLRMKFLHLTDVVQRYARNLINGRFGAISIDLSETFENRTRDLLWYMGWTKPQETQDQSPTGVQDTMPLFSALTNKYTPRSYDGSMLLFYAKERGREYRETPKLGWDEVVHRPIEIRNVPGDHYTFLRQPNVKDLIKALLRYQERLVNTRHSS